MSISEPYLPDRKEVEGYRIAVMAPSGYGKSLLARYLLEGLLEKGMQVLVLEPRAEWETLTEKYPVIVFGKDGGITFEGDTDPGSLADAVYRALIGGASVVVNFEGFTMRAARRFAAAILERVNAEWRSTGRVLIVVLEEAQLFAPQRYSKNSEMVLEQATLLATTGRKAGLDFIALTQRPALVAKDVLAQANIIFLGRFREKNDYMTVKKLVKILVPDVDVDIDSIKDHVFLELCCGRATRVRVDPSKVKTPHGGETIIQGQVSPPKGLEHILDEIRGLLRRREDYVTLRAEEYRALIEERNRLRKRVVELEKKIDRLEAALTAVNIIRQHLASPTPEETTSLGERERAVLDILARRLAKAVDTEEPGRTTLSYLARRLGLSRRGRAFWSVLESLESKGLIHIIGKEKGYVYLTKRGLRYVSHG